MEVEEKSSKSKKLGRKSVVCGPCFEAMSEQREEVLLKVTTVYIDVERLVEAK